MDGTLTKAVIDFADMRARVARVGGVEKIQGERWKMDCLVRLERLLLMPCSPASMLSIPHLIQRLEAETYTMPMLTSISTGDILDFIATLTPQQQTAAHAEIAAIEADALQNMQVGQTWLWNSHC